MRVDVNVAQQVNHSAEKDKLTKVPCLQYAMLKGKYATVKTLLLAGAKQLSGNVMIRDSEILELYCNPSPLKVFARKQVRRYLPTGYIENIITQHQLTLPIGLVNYLNYPEFDEF